MNRSPSPRAGHAGSEHLKGFFLLGIVLAGLLFAGMRAHELGVRPLHNDEGVNAWFLDRLVKNNDFQYDPENYHGPSLWYTQLVVTWANTLLIDGPAKFKFYSVSGLTDRSIRFGVVLASLLLLVGMLFTQHRIGPWGALTAFLLLGFSCNFLYFSRYFIHEMWVALFTFGIYWGATKYLDTRKAFFFYLFIACASLLFCTKETSIITYFVLGFSVVCTEVLHRFRAPPDSSPLLVSIRRSFGWLWEGLWGRHVWSLFIAVGLWLLLFSSFFSNWAGLADSLETYFKWTKEGVESGHVKPLLYWVKSVLAPYELALLVGAVVGGVAALIQNDKKGLYLLFWTLGMVGAYSVIPYKTVWCVINMLVPMALLSGYGVQWILDKRSPAAMPPSYRTAVTVVLIGGLLIGLQLPQTLREVYRDYDKEHHEPPYVHTSRDIFNLVKEIDRLAGESRWGKEIPINILSDVYWPLPHYLRAYTRVGYWGKYEGVATKDAPLLVVAKHQEKGLDPQLQNRYRKREFTLRSNFAVLLYADEDVFKEALPARWTPPAQLEPLSPPADPQPGLVRTLFPDRRCEGAVVTSKVESQPIQFHWKSEKKKPALSPFCLEWRGWLEVPESGAVLLALESDDGADLALNDQLVADAGGMHARQKVERSVQLERGWYRMRLTYFDAGEQAFLRFTWALPFKKEELVPSSHFYHTETVRER